MDSTETNKAAAVAMNADVRPLKACLMEEVPKLHKLAQKKVKGLSKDEIDARNTLVLALLERIHAIPDRTNIAAAKNAGGWGALTSHKKIKLDSDGNFGNEIFQQSEEGSQFREEYEMLKTKQDEGLDIISQGLDTLKNLAHDMNEELDQQVPLMDEIDTKLRSSRNFCFDIILFCIILGIASSLYNSSDEE